MIFDHQSNDSEGCPRPLLSSVMAVKAWRQCRFEILLQRCAHRTEILAYALRPWTTYVLHDTLGRLDKLPSPACASN